MKVLVTGGAGYIGSHTTLELLQAGYGRCGHRQPVQQQGRVDTPGGEDQRQTRRLSSGGPDRPFQASTKYLPRNKSMPCPLRRTQSRRESVKNPLRYYHNNLTGTFMLCEAMVSTGCRHLVFSSSATVYGEPASVPIREEFPLSATNPYGRTKLFLEQILRDLQSAEPRLNIALLRYFNPGRGARKRVARRRSERHSQQSCPLYRADRGRKTQTSPSLRQRLSHPGRHRRPGLHPRPRSGRRPRSRAGETQVRSGVVTYNLGTGRGYSVLEMIAAFEKAAGSPRPLPVRPAPVGRRRHLLRRCRQGGNGTRLESHSRHRRDVRRYLALAIPLPRGLLTRLFLLFDL